MEKNRKRIFDNCQGVVADASNAGSTRDRADAPRLTHLQQLGPRLGRSQRKRLIACLRMAHRRLGVDRRDLGLGVAVALGGRMHLPAVAAAALALGMTASVPCAHATEVACDANSPNNTCPAGHFGGIVDGSGYFSTVAGNGASGGGFFEATVYGSYANVTGTAATAIGSGASAAQGAIAIGSNQTADVTSGNPVGGAPTLATGVNSLALGSAATAIAGYSQAIGYGSIATSIAGVALGSGSSAIRPGLGGAAEAFSNVNIASTQGAVSVGAVGAERQIVNVAGGTVDTDAVNVRQLRAVGNSLAGSLGGGANFNALTDTYTAPAYVVGAQTYTNVGSAIAALNATSGGVFASDNTAGALQPIATGTNASAGGYGATALGAASTVVGNGATDNGKASAVAVGHNASVLGAGSIAIGDSTTANTSINTDTISDFRNPGTFKQINNLAVGTTTFVPTGVAIGSLSTVGNKGGVAIGYNNTAGNTPGSQPSFALGANNLASGNNSLALGLNNTTSNIGSIGIGTDNQATGLRSIAIGRESYAYGDYSMAQGYLASSYGTNSIAIGPNSVAGVNGGAATNDVALGSGAISTLGNSVALGAGSIASRGAEAGYTGYAVGATTSAGEIAVGTTDATRTITNVAAGRLGTDAVNVSQLNSVGGNLATSLGGGAALDPTTGAYTAPAYAVGGQTYDNVGAALTASNALAVQYTPDTAGAATNAIDLTRGGTLAPVAVTGLANATTATGAVALGQMPMQYSTTASPTTANPAVPSNDVTLVGADATAPVGLHNVAAGTLSVTSTDAVNGSQLYATNQTVAGLQNGTVGLVQQAGPGAPITVGAGTGGTAVSFADNAGAARRLLAVANGNVGNGSTDAVNGGQLYGTANSVATALGGGSIVNADGTVSAPTYSVAGTNYNNVGSAIGALDSGLANGQVGAFRSDNTAGAAAPAATGANSVAGGFGSSATGAGSTVLGNGATDNGAANATVLGNGAAVTAGLAGSNVALGQGTVAGRGAETGYAGYGVGATTSVGEVAVGTSTAARTITGVAAGRLGTDAVNVSQLNSVGGSLATSLGGGAAFDPATGAYTAPAYAVGGQTYDNVGAALGASNALAVQYTPDAAGGATNAIDLTKGGTLAPVAMTGLAAGTLSATSTDAVNGSQLYATNQTIAGLQNGTAGLVQQDPTTRVITVGAGTDGTTVGFANNAGAPRTLTGVAAGQVAANSTQAVNGGQLYGTASSVASALGGGSTVNADGTVLAPNYSVGGTSYNNVGGAITALDSTGVKYDTAPGTGARGQSITLAGGDPNQPVVIHNVAAGTAPTDAANVGQVQAAEAQANAYTNRRLAGVENDISGINNRLFGLQQQVNQAKQDAHTAAAIGLAAASLRYDDRPGALSVAAGGGFWKGESAGAFGVGYTMPGGKLRLNATAATDGRDVGAGGGMTYTFN